MADFDSMAQSVGGMRMQVTKSLKDANIQIRSFAYDDRAPASTDVMDQLNKLTNSVAVTAPASGGIMLGAFDLDFTGLAAGLGTEGPEGPLLREAKHQIHHEKYRDALKTLGQVLELSPSHHEATYLGAFCHHKSQEQIQALTVLSPLREANLSNRLATRVQCLRHEIRVKLLPKVTEAYMKHIRAKDPSRAIEALARVVELDPEVGKYHYFVASAMLLVRRHAEALQALQKGLKVAETERDELLQLQSQIDIEYVGRLLQPARKLCVEGKYGPARAAMRELDEHCQQSELWRVFDMFLEGKIASAGGLLAWFGGRKTAASGRLTSKQLEQVHSFLVRDELTRARQCVEARRFDDAETWLAVAVRYAPEYPLANYLYAVRIYERVGAAAKMDDQQAGKLRHIDKLLGQLGNAKSHARIGVSDSRNQEAPALADAIGQLDRELQAIRKEIEIQEHDAKYVNRSVDEFIQVIIKMTEPGMTPSKAQDVIRRMGALRDAVSRDKHKVKTQQGRNLMDAIEGIARQFFEIIDQLSRGR